MEDIRVGRLPLGSKLPSQAELVSRYQVSVNTVRQSLVNLERRGIIRTEQGRGSFVSLQSTRRGASTQLKHLGLIFERADRPEDRAAESEIVLTFTDRCRERGLTFTCVETKLDAHAGGRALVSAFDGVQVDGLCVFLHDSADAAPRLAPLTREFVAPVVFFPSYCDPAIPMDCVDIELRAGHRQLMSYLLGAGHRRIGFVSSHIEQCLLGDPKRITGGRWEVFSQAMNAAGVEIDRSWLVEIPYGREPGDAVRQQIVDLVRRSEPVTAVMAGNDWMARYVMDCYWRAGIAVPTEVSVIGQDNVSFAKQLIPSLTTVACPYTEAVDAILALMQQRLTDPSMPIQKRTIPSELIVRDSIAMVTPRN
jgi:DNA-binding LacI/PurR family transcriptional regulator